MQHFMKVYIHVQFVHVHFFLYMNHNMNQHVATVHEKKNIQLWSLSLQIFSKCILKKNVSWVLDGNKPFKCDICDYRSSRKSDLNKHVASVHEVNRVTVKNVELVHEGKSHSNVTFVTTDTLKRVTWLDMLHLCMKERSHSM